jgi:hypothetical protein
MCHRTLSGAPGPYESELATFGFQKSHSAIIHRTIRYATGLSGAPAEQRLQRNDRLQRTLAKVLQCADSSRRVRAAARRHTGQWTVPARCSTGLSGATWRQSSNGRNRQNPNSWVTWLAHRTVRCAHRQQSAPTVELVVGGYKYPTTTTTVTLVSKGQSRVHSIFVPWSISTHMLMSQV